MTIHYNSKTLCWVADNGDTATLPCYGLAIVGNHLYTRTEISGCTRAYTLEPCTSDDLHALMTENIKFGPIAFTGNYRDARIWLICETMQRVEAHQNDINIDLDIIDDLRKTDLAVVTYTVGFRKCGVDGISFIHHRSRADYLMMYVIKIKSDGTVTIHIARKEG